MSYSQPKILKDTEGHSGKSQATQNVNDEFSKIAKDLTTEKTEETKINEPVVTQNEPFVPPTEVQGINPADSSFSLGAGTINTDTSFYKSGGPITDPSFYVNPVTEPTITDPNDLDITKNIK